MDDFMLHCTISRDENKMYNTLCISWNKLSKKCFVLFMEMKNKMQKWVQ